jgi:DNA invertase Pin-like site-specific DNA recombinase
MIVGYARSSPRHQNLPEQKRALRKAGCTQFFVEDEASDEGEGNCGRPALNAMLCQVRKGDLVIVWRLDRLGRSFSDLANILKELSDRKVGFRSLCEEIDTRGKNGELVLRIVTAMIPFEGFHRGSPRNAPAKGR